MPFRIHKNYFCSVSGRYFSTFIEQWLHDSQYLVLPNIILVSTFDKMYLELFPRGKHHRGGCKMKGFFVAFDALPKESLMFLDLVQNTIFQKHNNNHNKALISKTYFSFVIPNIKVPFCGSGFFWKRRLTFKIRIFNTLVCRVEKKGNNKYKQHNSIQEVETMNQGLFVCMSLCEWKKRWIFMALGQSTLYSKVDYVFWIQLRQ